MPHPSMQPCRLRRILPNIRSAALILLAGLCTGCPHPLWLPDRNLKTKVTEPEIIGRWDITSNSLALLKRDGLQPADTATHPPPPSQPRPTKSPGPQTGRAAEAPMSKGVPPHSHFQTAASDCD